MHGARHLIACALALTCALAGDGDAAAQPPAMLDELFSAADGAPGPGGDHPPAIRRRFVRANRDLLDSGKDIRLNLFPDTQPSANAVHMADHANGLRSWSAATETGRALLIARGDSITGQVTDGHDVYEIRPVGGPVSEIRQIDTSAFPPDSDPAPVADAAEGAMLDRQATAGSTAFDAVDAIRVLIVYTPAAAAATADIEAAAQLAIDAANDAYANSNMATRIDLAATAETDYVESGSIATDLSRLQGDDDGYMDEVHALRNGYLADFVSLLTDDGAGYCGMAKLMSMLSPSFESSAFSVVWLPCASSNWTTAHEIGHNMGCQHDRANATSAPAFTYAFGYQDPGDGFRTIMGVAAGCNDCPRIGHFANPDIYYSGLPTGITPADPDAAACALAIDETAPVTTNFRTLVEPSSVSATTTLTDRITLEFSHPWPWSFQVYRAETGEPMQPLETAGGGPFEDMSAVPGTSYDYWVSALTALGEESEAVGPVTGVRAIPVCGNDVREAPAEDCDDGGTASDDGCDAGCHNETPLDPDEGLCIAAINDRIVRVAKSQGKENLSCLGAAWSGIDADVATCVVADENGKVGKARLKTFEADARFCSVPPNLGYAGPDIAATAAADERRSTVGDLFGDDVSAAIVTKTADAVVATCQRAIAKAADRLAASYAASFARCVKNRIGNGEVYGTGSLEACFDAVTEDAATPMSHLGMDRSRLSQARLKSCAAVDLSTAFPGGCAAAGGDAFDACVIERAACRTCLLFDAADALAEDCDLFDDADADSSCLP